MSVNIQTEEGAKFEALWSQYGDLVYNLAVRLECSPKSGWLLARSAFLEARRDLNSMEGRTPSQWLYEITINEWFAPYFEQSTFWKKHFGKKKVRWGALLPHNVEADLMFLSDSQETVLELLKRLDYPQRLVAVLALADGLSANEIARVTPLSEGKIKSLIAKAADRLAQDFRTSGVSLPADAVDQVAPIAAVIRQWQPLKAPMTLKADIINRRVTQKLREHDHIPNEISIQGMYFVLLLAILALTGLLAYGWFVGHHRLPSIPQ